MLELNINKNIIITIFCKKETMPPLAQIQVLIIECYVLALFAIDVQLRKLYEVGFRYPLWTTAAHLFVASVWSYGVYI